MIKPTVHLNGTSAQTLLDQYIEAGQALGEAMKALSATSPNGRDYYPQGPNAMKQAQKEHEARIEKVRDVLTDIKALAEYVADFT